MCMFGLMLWLQANFDFIEIKIVKKDEKVCGDQKFKNVSQQSGCTQSIYNTSENEWILKKETKCKC